MDAFREGCCLIRRVLRGHCSESFLVFLERETEREGRREKREERRKKGDERREKREERRKKREERREKREERREKKEKRQAQSCFEDTASNFLFFLYFFYKREI